MKIVLALHDYLPRHLGGTELHTHRLALALQARGHQVIVWCTERDLDALPGTVRERSVEGIRVLEFVHQREYADVEESWVEQASGQAFGEFVLREAPDVVHFQHLSTLGASCVERAARAGAATLITLHDYHLLCDRATLWREPSENAARGDHDDYTDHAGSLCDPAHCRECTHCLDRHPFAAQRWDSDDAPVRAMAERLDWNKRALDRVGEVIAPSIFLAQAFERAGMLEPGRARILAPGSCGPLRTPRVKGEAGPLRVGFLGGVLPAKGVHVLVQAVARLARAGVSLTLDVHGPLDWFPDYSAHLAELGRGAPVTLRGAYAPGTVDALLAELDLIVLPSLWYENHPLVLGEAWRNGLAVVASDLGGMAELVRGGEGGRLVPPGDVTALANTLADLAGDPGQLNALASARPPLTPMDEVVRRTEDLYHRCRLAPHC